MWLLFLEVEAVDLRVWRGFFWGMKFLGCLSLLTRSLRLRGGPGGSGEDMVKCLDNIYSRAEAEGCWKSKERLLRESWERVDFNPNSSFGKTKSGRWKEAKIQIKLASLTCLVMVIEK